MRTFKIILILVIAVLQSLALAQIVPVNPVNTQQISMPVFTLNPTPATGATVQRVGNPGPQTIYYWVVVNYLVGSSNVSGPYSITTAPNVLSASNYVTVIPIVPSNAISYDLLKTSTTVQPRGACACAVATSVSPSSPTNDQANTTGAYTVTPINMNALGQTLQNEVMSAGVSHLILRQNGAFVADLSLAGYVNFANVLSGTNLGQTLHVGNGSTLDATGTGSIAATTTPFAGVLAGTNLAQALHVGNGSTLDATGSGSIAATTAPFAGLGGGTSNGQTFTLGSSTFNISGTGGFNLSGGNPLTALALPQGAGAAPTLVGRFSFDTTAVQPVVGNGTTTQKIPLISGTPVNGNCVQFAVTGTNVALVDPGAGCAGTIVTGQPGYITFPGGLTFEWVRGVQNPTGEGTYTTNLPVAFSTACDSAQITYEGQGVNNDDAWYQFVSCNTTSVTYFKETTGGTTQTSYPQIFAIGH